MRVSRPATGSLIATSSDVAVCIVVPDAGELSRDCLRSVCTHTSGDVPIVIFDPAGRVSDHDALLASIDHPVSNDVHYVDGAGGGGLNVPVAMARPADVVVLHSDCIVAAHWLEGLRQAAEADLRAATASAVTLDAEAGRELDAAAASVRSRSLHIHPRLPALGGYCIYICRRALDLAGPVDATFFPDGGSEVRFSEICIQKGMFHVLADEVLVRAPGQGDGGGRRRDRGPGGQDRFGPLGRALGHTRRLLTGPSVVIDARVLSGPVTGTQVQVVELIAALARTEAIQVTAVVPDELNDRASSKLAGVPSVQLLPSGETERLTARPADIVHRPYQLNNPGDLPFLASLGERLIITHLDLISYRNPSYFADGPAWEGYRRLTRLALSVADHVTFLSAHVRDDAIAEDLLEPARATVVRMGVDHPLGPGDTPSFAADLPADEELLLCIGTDYQHKNRVFALLMLKELQRRHGWKGRLVLAGPSVPHGSSKAEECALLAGDSQLAERVVHCGPVSDPEKAWLYRRAALVLYPSIDEGFGLVPFEAATAGVACMWAPGTALDELLAAGPSSIVAWDAGRSADAAIALIREPAARERVVASVRDAAAGLTWDVTAAQMLQTYEKACEAPPASAGVLARLDGVTSGGLSEDAMRLVGPGGALPSELERPLLALSTNQAIGTPVFRLLSAAYRTGHTLRRVGRRHRPT